MIFAIMNKKEKITISEVNSSKLLFFRGVDSIYLEKGLFTGFRYQLCPSLSHF